MALTSAQITTAFQNVLQREPSAAELSAWLNASTSGALTDAQIYAAIVNSAEAINGVAAVVRVYQAAFGRVPDKAGLDQQTDSFVRGGFTMNKIAEGFVTSQEFANRYNGGTLVTDNAAAVTDALLQALYQNVLGRAGAAAEIAAWKALLTTPGSGYTKASDVLIGFSQSVEFTNKSAAAVTTFLTAAAQGTAVYSGALLDPGAGTGSTVSLTTGVDNLAGTGGDDVINAYINTTTATVGQSTLSGSDVVGGGAGTDTMNLSVEGANGTGSLTAATITGIEKFFIRDLNTNGASTYNFGTIAGETQAWNDRSTQAVTFSNLGTGATVGVKGDNSNNVSATTFTMATATDAVAIAFDGGVKGAAGVVRNQTGEAVVSITSTGAENTVGVVNLDTGTTIKSATITATTKLTASLDAGDFAASATLTLKGTGAIDLSGAGLAANIATVNAADNSGGVSVIAGANTTNVTGGTGNDTVSAGTLVFNSTGSLNGGNGTDTLVLVDQAQLTAATVAKMTNFEVLRTDDDNDGALDTFNTSLITGLTGVVIGAQSVGDGVSLTNVSAAVAGDITIQGNQAVGPTIAVTGATTVGQLDKVTLKINDGASTTSTITVADVTAAGVETVAIVATDNLTLSAATGLTAMTKLEVSGSGATNITTAGLALNVNTVVDASAATGTFTFSAAAAGTNGIAVTGSATKANNITTTALADSVTGGSANDTITGGNGIDTLNISQGGDDIIVLDGIVAAGNRDVVTGFTAGTYVIGGGQDRLEMNDAQATTVFAAAAAALQEVTSAPVAALTFNTAANNVLELAFDLTGNGTANDLDSHTDGTGLLASLAQTVAVSATTNLGYIVAYQEGKAYLFHANEGADGDANLAAADIALVGMFNGVAVGAFTASNFIDAA